MINIIVNIPFLVVSYFVGLFVDWVFQWQWQAKNKSKWGKNDNKLLSFSAVVSHSIIYSVITTLVLMALRAVTAIDTGLIVGLVLFATHAFIDTRIPVKWVMRFKGMTREEIADYQTYGFMHVGIDHRLHELVLLVLACFVR